MKKSTSVMLLAVVSGSCFGLAQAQTGLVNVSGATLLENYVRSNASTNDYIDFDGNGTAGYLRNGIQQLAPSGPSNVSQPLAVQYRVVGSVNGFIELTRFGSGSPATGNDTNPLGIIGNRPAAVPPVTGGASFAYFNRVLYINNGNSGGIPGTYNLGNPGGAPQTSNSLYQSLYAAPGFGSGGIIQVDVSPIDVSSTLATKKEGGSPEWNRLPAELGYGTNPVTSSARPFGPSGFGNLSSELAGLNGRNLFNPNNPGAADANTIFDNSLALAPIAPVVNYGTGIRQIKISELQHLFTTGRANTGENFVVITRDVGSGTRNAFNNCIGVDPSFGVGDNIGGLSTSGNNHVLGNEYTPTNKGSNGGSEQTIRNTRLGIGYVGTERGVTGSGTGSWLTSNALEIPDTQNDIYGGTQYVRPTTFNIVNNNSNGWVIGGQAVLATIGDPRSNLAVNGGQGWAGAFDPFVDNNCDGIRQESEAFTDLNGNGVYDATNAEAGLPAPLTPPMANPYAAAYVNNISRSISAATSVPADAANFGMPGEYAATQFLLLAAVDFLHDDLDYTQLIPNSGKNTCVRDYTLANNVHNNARFVAFNDSVAGKVPARRTGLVYSDGVVGGNNYIRQGSVGTPNVAVSYGNDLALRNKIAGDFNGSGDRDAGDVSEMLKAFAQRYNAGNPRWNALDGIYGAGAGEQAIIEVLGDFDGNGSFDSTDVRYYADGLYLVDGRLNRAEGFVSVDQAWATIPGGDTNFFNTIIATGKVYVEGDSAGDLAGSVAGVRKGYAPYGADGRVDAADINYVYAQYKNNSKILDGQANWDNLDEAVYFDLSADLNGDLVVDESDLCILVTGILGTELGDVNLDGVRDGADLVIAESFRGGIDRAGGWANGDVDGDGLVTESDLSIISNGLTCGGIVCPPCAADYDQDGGVTGSDVEAFFIDFESGAGCADVDLDGGVTGSDVEAFFIVFENGGC